MYHQKEASRPILGRAQSVFPEAPKAFSQRVLKASGPLGSAESINTFSKKNLEWVFEIAGKPVFARNVLDFGRVDGAQKLLKNLI